MSRWLLVVLVLGISFPLFAQDVPASKDKAFSSWKKYSQAELVSETTSLTPGAAGTIGLKIHLADRWHTYWLNPGDSGTAVRLQFKNERGVRVKQVMFPFPERYETGPLISFGYSKQVLFPIEVELDSSFRPGDKARIQVNAEWLICADVCIPAVDTYSLEVPVAQLKDVKPGPDFELFQKTRARVPRAVSSYPRYEGEEGESVVLRVADWKSDREFIDFFPFRGSGVTNDKPSFEVQGGELVLNLEKSNVLQQDSSRVGVLISRSKVTGQIEGWEFGDSGWSVLGSESPRPDENTSWLWMLVSAFLGGLILNLMPCVFPILSMKLLSLVKLGQAHPREVRHQNGAYVLGVMISFLAVALALSALRSAGHLVGWGFQLQSPVFLALLVWLFFALALNLLGVYEISFINTGFGHRLTRFGGTTGSFFTGVLAVVVASPCTAPFMGVALGFGLAQPIPILISVFAALGFGLAFPYVLFTIFPGWIRWLPRPGAWMNRLKQVMAFPMLLTVVWLLWILGQVQDTRAVAVVLGGCLASGLTLWLSSGRRKIAWAATGIALVGGLSYIYVGSAAQPSAGDLKAEAEGRWKPYSPKLLESLRDHYVFVNMTAEWCLTCLVNERLVFSDPEIKALLERKKVVLVKGDWTQRNEEITRFLNRYGRVGVPFYVLFSPQNPDGRVLPEVLTVNKFKQWIEQEFP
ncbi:MAG: protein-disulfide reductase DsbD family protein [Bdellovibrionales bacterium]